MTGTPFIAKQYIDAGWAVVPLVKGEKRAASAWQKKKYTPTDFQESDGIAGKCGEPSGWRVDVDCDCPEAVAAARLLLPTTGLIHGRPSKMDSHYWYECRGAKTTQFSNIAKAKPAMIVEIRSTGGYTMLPPSEHPSGDVLIWSVERQPLIIAPDDLTFAVRNVAMAALIAQHWGALSHASMGHLAGFLCQAKLPPFIIIEIFKAIGAIVPGNFTNEIVAFANTTIGKFEKGEPVSGGPKLVEALGEAVVNKLRSWLSVLDLDALEEMNAKHFFVTYGTQGVIGREDMGDGVVFQQPKALYIEYDNKWAMVGTDKNNEPEFKKLFPAWLESPLRRQYRQVVFSPPPAVAASCDYNLWKGFAVEPADGECARFLEHLHSVICSDNTEHFEYLMNLLALTFQEPGTPSMIATVMRGKPGTGKGLFVRALGDIVGRRYFAHLDKVEQLAGRFNAALSGKIIVFADEAFFAGDKREVGALKRLVTEPTLSIERKGLDLVHEDNHVHLFMATNEQWSWPAMLGERRGFLIEVSSSRMGDQPYFDKIFDELRSGGRAAFLKLLLERSIDHSLILRLPKTKELRTQQLLSLNAELTWWHECLTNKTIDALGWPEWVPSTALHAIYVVWANQRRHTRIPSSIQFGMAMRSYFSKELSKTHRVGGNIIRGFEMRSLDDAREYFNGQAGTSGEWEDEELMLNADPF